MAPVREPELRHSHAIVSDLDRRRRRPSRFLVGFAKLRALVGLGKWRRRIQGSGALLIATATALCPCRIKVDEIWFALARTMIGWERSQPINRSRSSREETPSWRHCCTRPAAQETSDAAERNRYDCSQRAAPPALVTAAPGPRERRERAKAAVWCAKTPTPNSVSMACDIGAGSGSRWCLARAHHCALRAKARGLSPRCPVARDSARTPAYGPVARSPRSLVPLPPWASCHGRPSSRNCERRSVGLELPERHCDGTRAIYSTDEGPLEEATPSHKMTTGGCPPEAATPSQLDASSVRTSNLNSARPQPAGTQVQSLPRQPIRRLRLRARPRAATTVNQNRKL